MENYEQKYKKALERAKGLIEGTREDKCDILEEDIINIFPELAENKDEKIRKGIIEYLEQSQFGEEHYQIDDNIVRGYIDWLEKQGKQNNVSIWKHWKDGIAGNGEGKLIYLVKSDNTYSLSSCLSFECDYIELSELDKLMVEKQGEPQDKGEISDEWTEEDINLLGDIILDLECVGYICPSQLEWLKSLKERIKK